MINEKEFIFFEKNGKILNFRKNKIKTDNFITNVLNFFYDMLYILRIFQKMRSNFYIKNIEQNNFINLKFNNEYIVFFLYKSDIFLLKSTKIIKFLLLLKFLFKINFLMRKIYQKK